MTEKRHALCLDHAAGLVLAAAPLAEDGVNLIDEHNAGLQLPCQTEHRIDQLIAITIPLLRQRRDVQVDEAGAGLVRQRLCQHRLAAARGAIEQHARRRAQQRRAVAVQVRHGERVDDALLELLDDAVEAANVLKRDGDLLGRDHLHGDGLLVRAQVQVGDARPPVARVGRVVVGIILAVALAPPRLAGQDGVELAGRGRGFGAGFFLGLGLGVEAREEVADDEVGDERLVKGSAWVSGSEHGAPQRRLHGVDACIGPRTAAAAMRMSGR